MIPYRALWSNLEFAKEVLSPHMKIGDNVISMLPMAHMYGMAFEFIFEFLHGMPHLLPDQEPVPNVLFCGICRVEAAYHHRRPLNHRKDYPQGGSS